MGEISAKQVKAIRETLLVCEELNDDSALHALFITPELAPFKYQLRQTKTKSSRADQLLELLVVEN